MEPMLVLPLGLLATAICVAIWTVASSADEKATGSTGFVPGDNKAAGLQSTVGNTSQGGSVRGAKVPTIRRTICNAWSK